MQAPPSPPVDGGAFRMSRLGHTTFTPYTRARIMHSEPTPPPGGSAVSSYSDVQKAVRVEKVRIWFAWLCGNAILLMIAVATQNIHIVSVVTQLLLVAGFLALTVALFRMTGALNRKAAAARREVLGEDYPG